MSGRSWVRRSIARPKRTAEAAVSSKALQDAARHLAARSTEVQAAWRQRMERFPPCSAHLDRLVKADPLVHIRSPVSSEQQGHDLASRGVPAECAAAGVAMYLESCLPLLKPAWTAAFAGFARAYGFGLLSGYTRYAR